MTMDKAAITPAELRTASAFCDYHTGNLLQRSAATIETQAARIAELEAALQSIAADHGIAVGGYIARR